MNKKITKLLCAFLSLAGTNTYVAAAAKTTTYNFRNFTDSTLMVWPVLPAGMVQLAATVPPTDLITSVAAQLTLPQLADAVIYIDLDYAAEMGWGTPGPLYAAYKNKLPYDKTRMLIGPRNLPLGTGTEMWVYYNNTLGDVPPIFTYDDKKKCSYRIAGKGLNRELMVTGSNQAYLKETLSQYLSWKKTTGQSLNLKPNPNFGKPNGTICPDSQDTQYVFPFVYGTSSMQPPAYRN